MLVNIEFSGGLELLFGNKKKLQLTCLDGIKLSDLIIQLSDLCEERRELFLMENTVRPGILVLVNDADWELCEREAYLVKEGDKIVFISTLHGG
jgi:ubiquitin related modifier 1